MTSTFDNLESIFASLERGEYSSFKIRAGRLASKVRKEIEAKVGKVDIPFEGWYWFFSTVHGSYDHTDKWHLKLVSVKTDREIQKLYDDMFEREVKT
ncbi:hypothetical protein GTO27_03430 [Candidatus Bathyarchaeota archaeon]|nr:hypothetical protein [Candidatus Bathyarchaeota archaeon]